MYTSESKIHIIRKKSLSNKIRYMKILKRVFQNNQRAGILNVSL